MATISPPSETASVDAKSRQRCRPRSCSSRTTRPGCTLRPSRRFLADEVLLASFAQKAARPGTSRHPRLRAAAPLLPSRRTSALHPIRRSGLARSRNQRGRKIFDAWFAPASGRSASAGLTELASFSSHNRNRHQHGVGDRRERGAFASYQSVMAGMSAILSWHGGAFLFGIAGTSPAMTIKSRFKDT